MPSFQGLLEAIYVTERKNGLVQPIASVSAVAGLGLEGDRYCRPAIDSGENNRPDREVTLIEAEAIEAIREEAKINLEPGQARRNLLTRGVPLNHLVGKTFQIGDVVLRGIRLCEPCGHLEALTQEGVREALIHRGGLRAQILQGGTLHQGDHIGLASVSI